MQSFTAGNQRQIRDVQTGYGIGIAAVARQMGIAVLFA